MHNEYIPWYAKKLCPHLSFTLSIPTENLAFWMQKLHLLLDISRLLLQYIVLDPSSIQIDGEAHINFSNTAANF